MTDGKYIARPGYLLYLLQGTYSLTVPILGPANFLTNVVNFIEIVIGNRLGNAITNQAR